MEEYPTSQRQFNQWFASERSCVDYLGRVRWPGGFICPRCRSIRAWVTGRGVRRCQRCDHHTSVTAGTLFHGTRTPLRKWFRAIWHLTDPEHGVSALALQEALGLGSYHTAWAWVRKLRGAMGAKMTDAPIRRRSADRGRLFCRLLEQAVADKPKYGVRRP